MTNEKITENLKDIDDFIGEFYDSMKELKKITKKSISDCNKMMEDCTDDEMKSKIVKTLGKLEEILYEDLNF